MELKTGRIAFPIEFDNGETDAIYFNPSDPQLGARIAEVGDRLKNRLNDMEVNGQTEIAQFIDATKKISEITKEELNYAFGSNVSDVVFRHCDPFALVDGQYFIVQFMNAITPCVEQEIIKANKKAQEVMKEYIDKYQK